jgi:2-oxo-4-hydroxy-4-carboxy-5-ureidoimidazoline decarboxylase
MTLSQLNLASQDEFVGVVGPVFEHSPWIAETAWERRPFASVEELHAAFCQTVREAGESQKLALIRARIRIWSVARHWRGTLTRESADE